MAYKLLLFCRNVWFVSLIILSFSQASALEAEILTKGWEYRWGDPGLTRQPVGEWLPGGSAESQNWLAHQDYPAPVPNRNDSKNLWMRVRLPKVDLLLPALIVDGVDQNMEVFLGREKIYSFGKLDEKGNGKFAGYPWHVIPLPDHYAEQVLSFRIWADHVNIGLIGKVRLAAESQFQRDLIRNGLASLSVTAILIALGIAGLFLFLGNRRKNEYLAFSGVALAVGLYIASRSALKQVVAYDPMGWTYVELSALYAAAVSFFALVDILLKGSWKNILRRLWQIMAVYAVISLSMAGLNLVPVFKTLLPFQLLFLLTTAVNLVSVTRKVFCGERDEKIIFLGMICLLGASVLDTLVSMGAILPRLQGSIAFGHWGSLALIVCFAIVLIKQILDVFARVIAHTNKLETLAKEGKQIEATMEFSGLTGQVHQSLNRLADVPLQTSVYFHNSVFIDRQLPEGYFKLDAEGNLNEADVTTRADVVKQGCMVFQVEDPRTSEDLALIPVSPVQQKHSSIEADATLIHKIMERNRALLEPIVNNMASAITTVRLQQTFDMLDRKTREIQTIFANIQQGIFMLDEQLNILPNYSTFLENFFDEKELAGKDFFEFVLNRSNLTADQISSAKSRMISSFGEDLIGWDINVTEMPSELIITLNGEQHVVEIDWLGLTDSNEIIERFVVTIRDITALRKLKAEAEAHREEIEMIGQIVTKPAEDFNAFIRTAQKYVQESVSLLAAEQEPTPSVLAEVKRNLHTIKGNSRVAGLKALASLTHEVESQLLKSIECDEIHKNEIILSIRTVENLVDRYEQIARERLGRSSQAPKLFTLAIEDSLSLTRKYMKDHRVEKTLRIDLQNLYVRLVRATSETISGVFTRVGEGLSELLQQLERPQPQFVLDGDLDWVLGSDLADALGSALTHMMRNSVDHGFRELANGTIHLSLLAQGADHWLVYRDTGRGLNLHKLREKGLAAGLITEISDDLDIAKLIFASSLSTAEVVTDISGRGVGMNAVKGLLEALGVEVRLELTGQRDEQGYRAFALRLRLPNEHLHEVIAFDELAAA